MIATSIWLTARFVLRNLQEEKLCHV